MPLDVPVDLRVPPLLLRLPVRTLLLLGGALALAIGANRLGVIDDGVVRVVGVAAGHGGLLAVALASADARWHRPAAFVIALLVLAAGFARTGAPGALAYLVVPAALVWLASRQSSFADLGIVAPPSGRGLLLGLAAGLFLGGHLLLSASRTFGYQVGLAAPAQYLTALAYDVGANVPSAECFFRGTLFNSAQRRWTFAPAVALATGAAVVRYLVDPALPGAIEVAAGAVFYVSLLSVTSCALFWWSGSLLPGAVAGLVFFAAYRALGGW